MFMPKECLFVTGQESNRFVSVKFCLLEMITFTTVFGVGLETTHSSYPFNNPLRQQLVLLLKHCFLLRSRNSPSWWPNTCTAIIT